MLNQNQSAHGATYLTTKDVARRLRLTVPTVQKYVRDDLLKAVRVGRQNLIEHAELVRFIEQMKGIKRRKPAS